VFNPEKNGLKHDKGLLDMQAKLSASTFI